MAGIVTQCHGWKTSGPVSFGLTSIPQVSLQIPAICLPWIQSRLSKARPGASPPA